MPREDGRRSAHIKDGTDLGRRCDLRRLTCERCSSRFTIRGSLIAEAGSLIRYFLLRSSNSETGAGRGISRRSAERSTILLRRDSERAQNPPPTPRHAASHRRRDRSRASAGRRQPRTDRPLREKDPSHPRPRLGRRRAGPGGGVSHGRSRRTGAFRCP